MQLQAMFLLVLTSALNLALGQGEVCLVCGCDITAVRGECELTLCIMWVYSTQVRMLLIDRSGAASLVLLC
jgi:hypothetical protein